MDLLTAALVGLPTAAAVVSALYVRAMSRRIVAAVGRAIDQGGAPSDLAFATAAAGGSAWPDPSVRELPYVPVGAARVTFLTMRDRALFVLAGRYAEAGAEAPAMSHVERELLARTYFSARHISAVADILGVTLVAADLPAEDPQLLIGGELRYRDDDDAQAWIAFGLAGVVLARAFAESTESDAWLLAARLSGSVPLFDRVSPHSRVVQARA